MRRLLPSRSPAWWAVVLFSLATVGIFMVFEVMDLDRSDLNKRIFQPPISSQLTAVDAEGVLRYGALPIQKALGPTHALVELWRPSTGVSHCQYAAPVTAGRLLARIRVRVDIHRSSLAPPAPGDEPPSTPAFAI